MTAPAKLLQFARFELDLRQFELRRAGRRVRLQRVPMDLLILLAERRGELVTREEIVVRVWPDAPADAEHSLNTAIRKIRQALGDDADKPQFVETVVGRGYRFIAATQVVEDGAPMPPADVGATAGVLEPDTQPAPAEGQKPLASVQRLPPRTWLKVAAAAGIGIAAVGLWIFRAKPAPLLGGFDQITRDFSKKAFQIGEIPLPILTDGSRLYFSVNNTAGAFELGQVAAAAGEAGTLTTSLPSPIALDVSPDGSELLVASPATLPEAPLWVQPVPNGSPRRLADITALSASWSPDGKQVAYSRRTGLYRARKDGTDVRALVSIDPQTGEQIYWTRWSPDGARLRYSLYNPKTGFHSIWEVSSDGTRPHHQILPGWNSASHECCGSWTRDGAYFVFAATRNGRSDIWAMREPGGLLARSPGVPVQLTDGPLSYFAPLPAAGGRVFVIGVEARGELVRHDRGSQTPVPVLDGISASGASFSRDGDWVVYVRQPDHTLWRSKADGTERLQLTTPPMRAYMPRWSPDGRQIAFHARLPGKPYQVYVAPVSGGTTEPLSSEEHHQIDPSWSSDGGSLVFERAPWEERGGGRPTELVVIDLQSRKLSTLPGSAGLVSPRWSPDGKQIAAMPADSGGLLLFDVATSSWRELMRLHIGYPNWSHDGRYIYFDRFADPKGIGRVRVSDRKVEDVLTPGNGSKLWTLDTWTGLTPDNSVMLLRDSSIAEIYALKWNQP